MSLGSYTLLGWIHVIIFIQLQSWARTKNKYTKSFWGSSSYRGLCCTLPSTCDTICTACSHQSCPYLWHWQKKRWHFSILYFLCYRYRLQVYCCGRKHDGLKIFYWMDIWVCTVSVNPAAAVIKQMKI